MTPQVQTLTGPVPAGQLGTTLIHEHLIVTDPELDRNFPHPEWDEERVAQQLRQQLRHLAELGVGTVVDLTVPGLGRDVHRVARMAAGIPVHIVVSTGYYTYTSLPPFYHLNGPDRLVRGPDPLLEMFVKDIREGVAGTQIRAGMIKVASAAQGITDDVALVFSAAAQAHRETGAPITTHSDPRTTRGLEQQQRLAEEGADLNRVVIGHSGDSADIHYLCALADAGSYVGFDRFGMAHMGQDSARLRMLLDLLERGYEDRILLSQDAAVFSRMTPPSWRAAHAPDWRMDHLHSTVLPQLRAAGMDRRLQDQLMVENPRRLLAGSSDE